MKLEIFDTFLNAFVSVRDGLTEEDVRAEAERCEVMYKVDGVIKSWKHD